MTDIIFYLQIRLVADDDRARKQDKRQIEQLVGEALKQVLPECVILKLTFSKND